MKLYIWVDPYLVKYGSSLLFAVADTLEDAKTVAGGAPCYSYGDCPNGAPPKDELGEPARVIDLPCAEWHEWSE